MMQPTKSLRPFPISSGLRVTRVNLSSTNMVKTRIKIKQLTQVNHEA